MYQLLYIFDRSKREKKLYILTHSLRKHIIKDNTVNTVLTLHIIYHISRKHN